MKRRVFLCFLVLFAVFGGGAGAAIYYITHITGSLGRLLSMHQVEYLRQNLVINLQTVQTDLYRIRTPLAGELESVIENVERLDGVAASCVGCHHRPDLARRIDEIRRNIEEYKAGLSFYITAAADENRVEALRREATRTGDHLFRLTQEMALEASRSLEVATSAALVRINRAKIILWGTMVAASLLALAVGTYLIRFITRPVDVLLEGTRAIQAGDLGRAISYQDGTEFGELAEAFNEMSAALRQGRENAERQQKALTESEWKFRTLSEFAHDWEYWLGVEGEVLYMSRSCEAVTGYTREELSLRPALIDDLVHPDDRAAFAAHLGEGLEAACRELEFRVVKRSGEQRWVSHVCGPILADGRFLGRFASNRDITDRKRLEEQLFQSQKMESMGHLAGGIAHDFNNLLTAILGFSSLLEARVGAGDEKARKALDQIRRAGERAQELTGSLLAFSRKQIMRPAVVDLNDVVVGLTPLLERVIGEDIALSILPAEEPQLAFADAHQMEHVLINLATNARDAMPGGGALEVRVGRERVAADGAPPGRAAPADYVVVSVRDNGTGVSSQNLPQIFEPFFTTKEKGRGTGLGLSTVQGIVEQHGGFLRVRSNLGKGSEFRVLVPRVQSPLPAVEEKKEQEPHDAGEKPRGEDTVLVAEDEESVRSLLGEILSENGYRVILAVDGADAIRKYDEHRAVVKIALLDVVMPQKNGREVYDHIRKIDPNVAVVFMSGYTSDILTSRGISEEGLEVLQKPMNAETLLARIRKKRLEARALLA